MSNEPTVTTYAYRRFLDYIRSHQALVDNNLRRLLYPCVCQLCTAPGHEGLDICEACMQHLPRLEIFCKRCALALNYQGVELCGSCLQKPPPYTRTYAPFIYTNPIDRLIINLKHNAHLSCVHLLGSLFVKAWQHQNSHDALPECLLPVPLHPARLRERGFNQSLELARILGASLHIPVAPRLVARTRATLSQQGLRMHQRRLNVHQAFTITRHSLPSHIAIVDDVMTTGSTVAEIASLLKKSGVARVDVWVLARA